MVNMGELFANPRLIQVEMDRVQLNEQERNSSLLEPGDLIFARQSLVLTGAGKCSIFIRDDEEVCFESHVIRCRLDKDLADPNFYFYFFGSRAGRTLIETIVEQGAGASGIRASDLAELHVPWFDPTIQKRAARVLSEIDDKIAVNRRINKTFEAMAQAIFKSWFVDFDPVRAKIAAIAEGRDPLRAAMSALSGRTDAELDALPPEAFAHLADTVTLFPAEMVESELGEIPKGWIAGPFKECCLRVESGGTPSRKELAFWEGTIPWLTSGEVRDVVVLGTKEKITRAGLDSSSAKLWPAMTTVVAMYGATAGQACLIAQEMTANQACCGLIPKAEFKTFIFVAARHSVRQLAEKASGSAQQNLNKALVEGHLHVIPDKEVAVRFELATSALLQGWILNQSEAATLAQLRDSLLPKLLSGELSVNSASRAVEIFGAD